MPRKQFINSGHADAAAVSLAKHASPPYRGKTAMLHVAFSAHVAILRLCAEE